MPLTFDDISALLFQALCTLALAAVHLGLWKQRKQPWHATWAAAWLVYGLRIAFIARFMESRDLAWLFAHQVVTLWSALLLLWAAVEFSVRATWRPAYALLPLLAALWAWFAVFVMRNMGAAMLSSALVLSAVTLGTGFVFLRLDRAQHSVGARLLAWGFLLWGLHHLDYPLLRARGSGLLIGVFMDVGLIVVVAVGTLVLVLGEERRELAQRTAQLEQLSGLLVRAQEEERRRIARELHDEAGQTLTALKIELDLEGRSEASARVAEVLGQIRNVSELLRPRALDDLGLVPALRAMVADFSRRTHIDVAIEADDTQRWPPEAALTLYRVAQEALTNVARHSGAQHAWVRLSREPAACLLVVEDDGRGPQPTMVPHLGVLGMRERVSAAGGTLQLASADRGGMRVEAVVPSASPA